MPIPRPQPVAEQPNPYLPPGPQPLVFEKFMGINTATTRPGVPDEQMWWCDGFMPLAPRFLRTLYGVGPTLWTVPGGTTLVFFDFANIGSTPILVGFLSDGSIQQVNTDTGVQTQIAPAGTIQNPSRQNVGMCQWGSSYVIIVSVQTDGYFIWDGTTFYTPGGSAPVSGTMPTGISGTAVETYAGRVWVCNGANVGFTSPGSVSNFASADGGGFFTSSDSFLRVSYIQLKQTNGFLYLIADSSVNYLSGVQTSGTPPVTTFTNQNADPEVGSPWPASVNVFGRNIMLANAFGVHVSYGAAVTKVSEALDGVYNSLPNFGGLFPSAAKAIIFGKKVWMLLLPIIDPVGGQQINKLFMWNGKHWWASGQDATLTYIQHQEINSVLTAWGTNGTSVYPLFQTPSDGFTKVVQSRLWDAPGGYQFVKSSVRIWGLAYYYSIMSPEVEISIDNELGLSSQTLALEPLTVEWLNDSDDVVVWKNASNETVPWFSSGTGVIVFPPQSVGQQGVLTGLTLTTNAADMALVSMMLQDEIVQYRG